MIFYKSKASRGQLGFGRGEGRRSPIGGRLIIGLVIAAVSLISYFGKSVYNPITNEKQHIGNITPDQEIGLGLQAAPEMAAQYGGDSTDARLQGQVNAVGRRIVQRGDAATTPYEFQFHLLADENTINAFALPGGQVFITEGLRKRLKTEGQLAGVLGHEIGHVVARHGAQHIAKAQLTEGLTGAAVLATYDPRNPSSRGGAAVVALVGQLVNLKFSRNDESQADELGVRFTGEAGYDPRAMIGVMEILEEASRGGEAPPEFFSTHPNPANRIESIKADIEKQYPGGLPEGLQP